MGWLINGHAKLPYISTRSPSASFRYTALSETSQAPEIRIVQLEPGSGSQAISCKLQTVRLQNPLPQYDAISYTWGKPHRTKEVLCDGAKLLVTENLYEALRNIRTANTVVSIWIDQLCINQEDDKERASQVQFMGKIYASAQKVVIWLGDEHSNSKRAFALGEKIAETIEAYGADVGPKIWEDLRKYNLPKWQDKSWHALGLLMRRPWFERTWTIQEIVKARSAIVKCGKCTISWERLSSVASALDFETMRPSYTTGKAVGSPTHCVRFINGLRAGQPDPLDLLIDAKNYRATDTRDKIYAFLGLCEFDIEANYGISTVDLYVRFANQYVRKVLAGPQDTAEPCRKVMDLVLSAGRAAQQEKLPSWVPDWSTHLPTRPLVPRPLPPTPYVHGYYAGGSDPSQIELVDGDRLRLSAKLCDSVAHAGIAKLKVGDSMGRKEFQVTMDEWLTDAMGIYSLAGPWYPTGESKGDVFKQTLIAGRNRGGEPASVKAAELSYDGWGILFRRPAYLSFIDRESSTGDEWVYFHSTMAARGRVLMLTSGGYMGLVPHGTREGDIIGILIGGGAPVVLRLASYDLHGPQYELIGEAYIHGWMDGEMVGEVPHDSRYKHVGIEQILLV
jgi:hypothetical protein